MNRSGFLKKIAGALVGMSVLRHLPAAPVAASDVSMKVTALSAFPEGTFILDSGSLDLGIVRDSVLTSTDDWLMFGEVFESGALLGRVEAAS